MNRYSMIEKLIAHHVAKIAVALKNGDAEDLAELLMSHIGYDFKTLREIIDEYNSINWEDA